MSTTSHRRLLSCVALAVLLLGSAPATSAQALPVRPAGDVSASASKKKAPTPALRLKVARKSVTAGARVNLRVSSSSKVSRPVRIQRWDPRKRAWRTVAKRKVNRGTTRLAIKVPAGTWRFRAQAPRVNRKARAYRAVRSASVVVKGVRPNPSPRPIVRAPGVVGSVPVGSASYPVPAGAVFVAALGSSGGSGSQGDPYGSLGTALAKARSGSTVVLRAGVYRESVRVPFGKRLVIQSYPGEAVWLDGSVPVTGWQRSGSTWVVSGWNHNLDSRVSFSSGNDQTSWFVDPKFPMAGHPDQVWVGGQRLAEVGSVAQVKAGTFFVDTAAKRLVIGSDPTGKRVDASVLQRALQIQGEGTVVRGIGVRRYANTLHLMGAVTAEVKAVTLENMVITQNATVGVYGWNQGQRFRRLTVTENGILGFGYAGSRDVVLEQSIISGNNVEHFNAAPVAGGIKFGRASAVTIRSNLVERNINSSGIWLDESVKGASVVGNTVRENDTTGIMAEISDSIVIADNHITRNAGTGIWSYSSSNVDIWNNTLVANSRTLAVWQDERDTATTHYRNGLPWLTKNINIHNNEFSYGSNVCPILTQDLRQKWNGNQFGITSNNNAYHRATANNPAAFACWANGRNGTTSFPTLTRYQTATGNDTNSTLTQGRPVTATNLLAAPTSSRVARALPARIARVVGQPAGVRTVGAYSRSR